MFINQVQQAQQSLNSVQQLVSQLKQSEQTNSQKLQQIAQEELFAAQQLQRVQQICQEVVSSLQSISYTQPAFAGAGQAHVYPATGQNWGTTQAAGIGYATSPIVGYQGTGVFNPATMSAETYQGTLQTFGNVPGFSGATQTAYRPVAQQAGLFGGQGYQATAGGISNIATMSPDTYISSREHLGKSNATLSQIGQQAGINQTGISAAGMTTGAGVGVSDVFQASQQGLAGTAQNLGQVGQQAGVSNVMKGYNQ